LPLDPITVKAPRTPLKARTPHSPYGPPFQSHGSASASLCDSMTALKTARIIVLATNTESVLLSMCTELVYS